MQKKVKISNITVANARPFVLIAGPCVIENRKQILAIADFLKKLTQRLQIPFIFKASYDKANRTSLRSYRGPGIEKGLTILEEVKKTIKIPVLSDVHCVREIDKAASVLDILQIPAFLCRQTDLIVKAAKTQRVINIKKGQFLAPWDVKSVIHKITAQGNHKILITERGVSFGYNTLVSDFRSLAIIAEEGYPVVFDASHSVQQPGGLGTASGGQSQFIPLLSRCAVAAGCAAIFMEVHPSPKKALSDGPNMLPLNKLEGLLKELKAIDSIIKNKKGIKKKS